MIPFGIIFKNGSYIKAIQDGNPVRSSFPVLMYLPTENVYDCKDAEYVHPCPVCNSRNISLLERAMPAKADLTFEWFLKCVDCAFKIEESPSVGIAIDRWNALCRD